jgi:anti-sigma B factor antagonist
VDRYSLAFDRLNGRVLARVGGELDIATTPKFMSRLQELIDDGVGEIELDLSELNFCDSSCLRGLMTLHDALATGGGRLTLVSPGSQMQKLLEITSLTGHFHIRPAEA